MNDKKFIKNTFLLDNKNKQDLKYHYQVMVDFDSTIFPLIEAMAQQPGCERVRYEAIETWEKLPELCDGGYKHMIKSFDEVMKFNTMINFPPLFQASKYLKIIQAHGVDIYIMTQRKNIFYNCVQSYLKHFDIPYKDIFCDIEYDKIETCKKYNINIAIDDSPYFLEQAHQKGMNAMSLKWKYNARVIEQYNLSSGYDWETLSGHVLSSIEESIKASV